MRVPCKNIPTYINETDEWTTTSFDSQYEFGEFLLANCFKEPGEYNFPLPQNYSYPVLVDKIGELGKRWEKEKNYTELPEGSKDWEAFWENEELKCRLGILWKHGNNTWYITRDYYFFLNFCPITNKEKGQEETMASFRDVQYHMMVYEKIAEIFHKYSGILKRRQMAYSLCHVAKCFNYILFENKKTIKWFASDDAFLDDTNGSWKFLNAFKNHMQTYTAWDKVFDPNSYPTLQQKEKIRVGGKWLTEGNDSTIVAKTLKRDPKAGVGGAAYFVWYEEGGIAPTADVTLEYMDAALSSGTEKVGSFCIGGSVGDLKQCAPLERFIKKPTDYDILAVPTKWWDGSGQIRNCGLFVPAQYGMPQAVDEGGNSLVEKALELLYKAEHIGFLKGEDGRIQDEPAWINLPEEKYILKKSQNPKTIDEAFAYREVLYFPTDKIMRRQKVIEMKWNNKELLKPKQGLLDTDEKGNVIFIPLDRMKNPPKPLGYPIDEEQKDKRGCVTIYKDPPKHPEQLQFFGGIDTIESSGKTTTSNSVFSIYIIERLTETEYYEGGQRKFKYSGGGICASYVGRFDEIEDTNHQGELLIRLYNAFCACERNKPNFIQHMRARGLAEKHMMKRKDLHLFKDLDNTGLTNDDFGVWVGSDGQAEDIINGNIKEDLLLPLDTITKKDKNGDSTGEVLKTIRGLDVIEDYFLLEELKRWYKGLNTDRRVAYGLAKLAAKCYTLTYGYKKIKITNNIKKPVIEKPKSLLPSINNYSRKKGKHKIKSLLPQ